MRTLQVNSVLHDKVLVSRESARLLEPALNAMMAGDMPPVSATGAAPITVDFSGVEGIAPSFLDELLTIFEAILGTETNGRERSLIVSNPPTRLSLKFEAIARGHEMSVRALPDGSWILKDSRAAD